MRATNIGALKNALQNLRYFEQRIHAMRIGAECWLSRPSDLESIVEGRGWLVFHVGRSSFELDKRAFNP